MIGVWYVLAPALLGLLLIGLSIAATLLIHVQAELALNGYYQLTLGPLWVMILPGYVAVSW